MIIFYPKRQFSLAKSLGQQMCTILQLPYVMVIFNFYVKIWQLLYTTTSVSFEQYDLLKLHNYDFFIYPLSIGKFTLKLMSVH